MTAGELLDRFERAFIAQQEALGHLGDDERRRRTERPGQYHLDTIADAAVLSVVAGAETRVLSEESGWTGPSDARVTIVVDPVDGSTNCARRLPYWAISLCAVDADGLLCALVANGATGDRYTATRGLGACLNGRRIGPSATTELGRAVVAISGLPPSAPGWRQFRALGSSALALCDVAAGHLDAYADCIVDQLSPWDYLGALLVCREAGADVVDAEQRPLVALDPDARRQIVAAATPELLEHVRGIVVA